MNKNIHFIIRGIAVVILCCNVGGGGKWEDLLIALEELCSWRVPRGVETGRCGSKGNSDQTCENSR